MMKARSAFTLLLPCTLLAACGAEKRTTGPSQPQTPPNGPSDPRIPLVEASFDKISQGGRYFAWYGCNGSHAQGAPDVRAMYHPGWKHRGSFDQVYSAIASHPGISPPYGMRIPAEQLWQITAYVRSLPTLEADRRRRQDFDQKGEPQAATWSGPVQ